MKNSQQPAFSSAYAPSNDWNGHCELGMTKREYFAAKAMQGLLAGDTDPDANYFIAKALAIKSVEYADALLAELENTNQSN